MTRYCITSSPNTSLLSLSCLQLLPLFYLDVSNFLPTEAAERALTHRRKGSSPERPRTLDPLPDNLLVDIK